MTINLAFSKQNNNLLLQHLPSPDNGGEGDVSISSLTSKGIYLSAKTGGQWYTAKLQNPKDLDNGHFRDLRVDGISDFYTSNTTFRQGFTSLGDVYIRATKKLYMGTSTTTNISGSSNSIVYSYDDTLTEALTMTLSGDMVLDKNFVGTTTATEKAIYIDFDATGITASGQTATNIGLDLDLNTDGPTMVGTVNNTGIDIDLVAGTSGTQTNTGIAIDVDGADTNTGLLINTAGTHIKLEPNADVNDYATIAVADTGDLTIATNDSAAASGDLILDIDGDIELNADGGSSIFKDNTVRIASINSGAGKGLDIYSQTDVSDFVTIACGSAGATTITTIDNAATAAHLTLDIDGSIITDPADGKYIAKNNGTEFSATDSAYAGMILGYTCLRNLDNSGGGAELISIGTSFATLQTVAGNDVKVTFVAPPSGNVEIVFSALVDALSKIVYFALSDNATYNELNAIHTYDGKCITIDESDENVANIRWFVTGLTAGTSYTYFIGAKVSSSTASIPHGINRFSSHSPPIIVKATALPGTNYTGQ